MALEPCYGKNGGNAVRVYTRDGHSYVEEKSMKAALRILAAFFGVDLKAVRKKYGRYLHCALSIPLPLMWEITLIPGKMRLPRYENDGATGYINYFDVIGIDEIEENEEGIKCLIHLKGGHSLPCYTSAKKMRQRLHQGKLVTDHYRSLHDLDSVDDPLQQFKKKRRRGRWSRLPNDMLLFIFKDEDDDEELPN